jgi:6-phosphofructo-2-kinase / fructose-2,6-biphosphatase 2
VLFLESYCDDPAVVAANVALKVTSGDPDYAQMSKEDAERDFRNRIKHYESVYETLTEPHLSYVKIINVGAQVQMYRIHGYLQSRIAFYLMNLHLKPRSIFMSRVSRHMLHTTSADDSRLQHGESQFNVEGKIGGDAPLSSRGRQYADALPKLVKDNIGSAELTVSLSGETLCTHGSFLIRHQIGLDLNSTTNHRNRGPATLPKVDLEIARRTRCRCLRWDDI